MGTSCNKPSQISKVQDLETDFDVSFIHRGLVKTNAGVLPKPKVNEMILDFEGRLMKNTKDMLINLCLGICLYSQGFYESAEQHLKLCLKNGIDYKGLYVLGLIYMHKECFNEAAEYFFNSIRLDPEFWPAYLKSAEICLKNDNLDQVKKLLKKLKMPEENPEVYFIKGIYYQKKRNFIKSKKYLKKSADSQFEIAKSYFFLGDTYLQQKNWEKSLKYYQNSLMHSKGSLIGLVKVSQSIIHLRNEKFDLMLKNLKESLQFGPQINQFIKAKGFGSSINNPSFLESIESYLKHEYKKVIKEMKPMYRENREDLIPGLILALAYFYCFRFEKSLHYSKKLLKSSKIDKSEIGILIYDKSFELIEKCEYEIGDYVGDETSLIPNKPYSFVITA